MSFSDEDSYSTVFFSLKHPLRRKILRTLTNGPMSFSDLKRQMGIEGSHLTYHLEGLGDLLLKTENGKYGLSSLGEAAVLTMKQVEEPTTPLTHFPSVRPHRANILKWLTILLICGLVASLVLTGVFLLKSSESDKAYNDLDKAYNGLYQAYTNLNTSYYNMNQAYTELNRTNGELQIMYANLSNSAKSLQSDSPTNIVRDVNTSMEYSTIQQAINAGDSGDIILVGSGVYYEHLIVNKTLTLLGASKEDTIIDGLNTNIAEGSPGITITADNVVLDGFTVRNCSVGVYLDNSNDSTLSGNIVTLSGEVGISLYQCCNTTVRGNLVSSTIGYEMEIFGDSIRLYSSTNNTIDNNFLIQSPQDAIALDTSCNNNLIVGNVIENTDFVLRAYLSNNNTIFHNDLVNIYDVFQVSSNNSWSVGGQGNYWSDYTGVDNDSDGVGDTNLPWHGVDNYPLISPVNPLLVFWNNTIFPTSLISNSTVSAFTFDQANNEIAFNLNGPANTTGFFNMSIPSNLLSGPWTVLLNGNVANGATITQNETFTTIYLNYDNNTHSIQIIGANVVPEYPTNIAVLSILFLTLAAIAVKGQLRLRTKLKQKSELC